MNIFKICGLFALLLAANLTLAQQTIPPGYVSIPASTDGIGKRYLDREISGVMGWQGAKSARRDLRYILHSALNITRRSSTDSQNGQLRLVN